VTVSKSLTLGFVAIARTTFDIPLATEVTAAARASLTVAGFTLVGPETLVSTAEDVAAATEQLTDQPLDALLVLQATFADSGMILALAQAIDAPLLLWAVPEARTGGRLRLNSLCGINLAGHALTRAGITYDYVYAAPDDAGAVEQVRTLAQAGRVRRRLHGARIAQVGAHPAGFPTCAADPNALKRTFGLELVRVDLPAVFEGVRAAESQQVAAVAQELGERVAGLDAVDQTALRGTLGTYLTLRDLAARERLDGLAVRCWPEFFTELGCAACGSMSMLSDEFTPCSCEADVNGTITQLILQEISGAPAFGSDVVSFDLDEDVAIFWHCGLAPLSMADPAFTPRATIHSNRRLPLLMEFPLRPGRMTIARLSEATGSYRLVVGSGEMVRAPLSFSGTSGALRFDRPARAVLDTIMREGLEHHLSLTYGDHVAALLALARMLDLPVLHL